MVSSMKGQAWHLGGAWDSLDHAGLDEVIPGELGVLTHQLHRWSAAAGCRAS